VVQGLELADGLEREARPQAHAVDSGPGLEEGGREPEALQGRGEHQEWR
jgi:hypothetical protein